MQWGTPMQDPSCRCLIWISFGPLAMLWALFKGIDFWAQRNMWYAGEKQSNRKHFGHSWNKIDGKHFGNSWKTLWKYFFKSELDSGMQWMQADSWSGLLYPQVALGMAWDLVHSLLTSRKRHDQWLVRLKKLLCFADGGFLTWWYP